MNIYKRKLFSKIEPYLETPEAVIITGMRRVGKTTLLRDLEQAVQGSNKVSLDLENPLNRRYFEQEDFEKVKFSLEQLGLDFRSRPYIFLDEIQLTRGLPQCVKYFIDHYNAKFFLTGSASFYLKNLFSESLSGRKYIFELYPLTFSEFLLFKKAQQSMALSGKAFNRQDYQTIMRYYQEYVIYGGFPQVVLKDSVEEKKRTLEDIFTSYFQLEVAQFSGFRKADKLRDLILLLLARVGAKLEINKLADQLSLSRPTVMEYIAFLEGTYFIHLIKPYSRNIDVEIKKMPKLYFCDSGLANHLGRLSEGSLFEQSVFQNLMLEGDINYYQKKNGAEIDFIINQRDAYEAKLHPAAADLSKLERITKTLGLSSHCLVSYEYTEVPGSIYGFSLPS